MQLLLKSHVLVQIPFLPTDQQVHYPQALSDLAPIPSELCYVHSFHKGLMAGSCHYRIDPMIGKGFSHCLAFGEDIDVSVFISPFHIVFCTCLNGID
jgi:hypothetical protein